MFNAEEIRKTCYTVMRLGKLAQLQFKALPVIQWEFADKSNFFRAEAALKQALDREMTHVVMDYQRREMPRVGVVEFDCYGVTFRLICKTIAVDVRRMMADKGE
jgi:hypothetical protein